MPADRPDLPLDASPLTADVRAILDRCVLCWLATADASGAPSVSPKEVFAPLGDRVLVIADIASPNSVRNIVANPRVCVTVLDVFAQRGYKLLGSAIVRSPGDDGYDESLEPLRPKAGSFKVRRVIEVAVERALPVLAPSYHLVPGTTEATQIESAMRAYGVVPAPPTPGPDPA